MQVKFEGVSETLLITLYIRAKDAMSNSPIINDKMSIEIMNQIEYDFEKFKKGKASYFGTLARIKAMDREAKKFIEKHPECNIISIGCGLDTRFERIDNGKITWYNLDFPEVMEKRRLLFKENSRVINIEKSALDPSWTKEVKDNNQPILILSEGVLMYLDEEEIGKLLNILTSSFNGFEVHFDLCHKNLVNKGKKHDTVKHTNAEFKFGVTDGREICKINDKLELVGIINFTEEMSKFKLGAIRMALPIIRKMNNRLGIYRYSNLMKNNKA